MSFSSSQDAKEQVRQATDIVDLVGSYLQLRRQGRGYVGLCPWHPDSRPSMQVNPERQSFKCWVCDIGGDVFSFVMKIDGLEFREALELLADRAGISLAPTHQGPKAEPGSPGDKKTLYAALAWAEQLYHRCLLESPEGDVARRYLAERGVSADSIARFQIGFAPTGWDWLLKQAPAANFSPAVLDRVNLIASRKSNEGWYDQFRGRLMFPIRDVRSRPVAFGGRVLPEIAAAETRADYKPAKYVNSSETPVYSKSHTLYALDLARDAIQKRQEIVVMEGYTDVLAAHQAGVQNVVAACGTAMGEGHLKLIRRFTDRLVLVLDGDEAGRRRASELLELFIASPIDLRILTLPDGLDPCDFIASHGSDKFDELLTAAPDALEHKLQTVTQGMVLSADNTHAASQAIEQMLGTLAKTQPALGEASSAMMLREQNVLGRLSRHFQLPEAGLRTRLNDLRRGNRQKTLTRFTPISETEDGVTASDVAHEGSYEDARESGAPASETPIVLRVADLTAWDREALELILTGDELAQKIVNELGEIDFETLAAREIFSLFREVAEEGEATYESMMLACKNEMQKSFLVTLDASGTERSVSDSTRRFNDLLLARSRRLESVERGRQVSALRSGEVADSEADAALAALFASRKSRETGSRSTEG